MRRVRRACSDARLGARCIGHARSGAQKSPTQRAGPGDGDISILHARVNPRSGGQGGRRARGAIRCLIARFRAVTLPRLVRRYVFLEPLTQEESFEEASARGEAVSLHLGS